MEFAFERFDRKRSSRLPSVPSPAPNRCARLQIKQDISLVIFFVCVCVLDEPRPEPALFPAEPVLRSRVVDAERWGEERLQPVARRVGRFGAVRSLDVRLGRPRRRATGPAAACPRERPARALLRRQSGARRPAGKERGGGQGRPGGTPRPARSRRRAARGRDAVARGSQRRALPDPLERVPPGCARGPAPSDRLAPLRRGRAGHVPRLPGADPRFSTTGWRRSGPAELQRPDIVEDLDDVAVQPDRLRGDQAASVPG